MSVKIKSTQDILNLLGRENFQHLSTRDIFKIASYIPDMDKEVAIKCIEQFPEFAKFATNALNNLYSLYDRAINEKSKDKEIVVEQYKIILDELKFELQEENVSYEQKQEIIDKMISVTNDLAIYLNEHASWIDKTLNNFGKYTGIALLTAAGLIGINIISKYSDVDFLPTFGSTKQEIESEDEEGI